MTVYDLAVAPWMVMQAPSESQRLQAKVYDFGGPVQVPRVVVTFSPTSAVPVMTGAVLFTGFVTAACGLAGPRLCEDGAEYCADSDRQHESHPRSCQVPS